MTALRISSRLMLLLTLPFGAAAHRLDECLQATRVSMFSDHLAVQTFVTPGTLLAARLFARIDADRDGNLSQSEGRRFADQFVQEITLTVDGNRVPLTLTGSQYPTLAELSGGEAMILFEMSAATRQAPGRHRATLRNDNDPAVSIYLANAMLPKDPSVPVVRQERDPTQRTLTVEYDVAATLNSPASVSAGWLSRLTGIVLGLTLVLAARQYLRRRASSRTNQILQAGTEESTNWGNSGSKS